MTTPADVPFSKSAGYHAFSSAMMGAVSDWGIGGFIDRLLGNMIGLWLGWLRERTERRLAQIEAQLTRPASPALTTKPTRRSRPARSRLPKHYAHEWQVPPQWSLPLSWPLPPGPEPRQRRAFGWLCKQMEYRGMPYKLMLEDVLATPEMVRLFTHSQAAAREWTPLLRMLGVDSALIRYPGQTPPTRRTPAPRRRMSQREKWWRALARDPHPQMRFVNLWQDRVRFNWPSRMQLRPKGSIFMETGDDAPPGWHRTAW